MAMTAPIDNNKKDFGPREEPRPGMRPARIFRIVDIGSHIKKGYQGAEDKVVRQVRIDFELPTELLKEGEFAGKPMVVGETFTFSTGDKASLRKKIINPLFPGLSKDEGFRFDLTRLLGQEVLVQLVKSEPNAQGKSYINIQTVTPLPEGMPCSKEHALPQVAYSLGDAETYEVLPNWLKNKILDCEEFKAQSRANAATGTENEVPF